VHWKSQHLKFPVVFKSAEEKVGIFAQNWFLKESILDISVTLKQNAVDT